MKTHQEIRDAISAISDIYYMHDSEIDVLLILHALNDRIETVRDGLNLLERMSAQDKVETQRRLEEIHPTII